MPRPWTALRHAGVRRRPAAREDPRRQPAAILVAAVLAGLFSVPAVVDHPPVSPADAPSGQDDATARAVAAGAPDAALSWGPAPVDYTTLTITTPGTYNLASDTDYDIVAPERIDGAVHLRGGRNIRWVGGHIHIPDQGAGPVPAGNRRGLVISDIDDQRGDPDRYGHSVDGRIVHIEGLLLDGPDLAEGINTNAPAAVIQLANIRVGGVHFRNSDDRDGTNGWGANHPDVIQTWGGQKELRIDGLTAASAYQGLYLSEATSLVRGPMWLRRVNLTAYEHPGDDGSRYAGHRMLTLVGDRAGTLHLDPGTVWVAHHANSGWNLARTNPAPDTAFWRVRYWNGARYVDEAPPGDAVFTDALGNQPARTATDTLGTYAEYDSGQIRAWTPDTTARVYAGTPTTGDYVPTGTAGTTYTSPGYQP